MFKSHLQCWPSKIYYIIGQGIVLVHDIGTFRSLVPRTKDHPTDIPSELLQALVPEHPDWTSENWIKVLRSTCQESMPHSIPIEVDRGST